METLQFLKVHYDAFHLSLKQECEKHGIEIKFREDFSGDIEQVNQIEGWCPDFYGKNFESGRFRLVTEYGWRKTEFPMEAEIKGVIRAGYQTWTFAYKYADYLEPLFETNAPLMTNIKSDFVIFLKKLVYE